MPENRKVRWGVLGTASIAENHTIPGMVEADNCQLYAVAGRSLEKAEIFSCLLYTSSTVEEFIEYAKAHPGELTVGNAGTGSIWHLGAIGLEKAAGVTFNHVPFDGASKSIAALMGGHVDAVVSAPIELMSGAKGNEIQILATMGEERSQAFPDAPTLKESGIDYELLHWGGFAGPKDLPEDVKAALQNALKEAVERCV